VSGGILVTGSADQWWAWAALRIGPMPAGPPVQAPVESTPGGWTNEFSGTAHTVVQFRDAKDIHIHQADRPPPDDRPWFLALGRIALSAHVELRYLHEPGLPRPSVFLAVRASAPDRSAVIEVTRGLRTGLADLPPRCHARPVESDAELRTVLDPFTPASLVEVRKRLSVARPIRTDTRLGWLSTVRPFGRSDPAWAQFLTGFGALPHRAMLSVGLAPFRIGDGLRTNLAYRVRELTRLARPGPPPTGTWSVGRDPDPAAAEAVPVYADAERRYAELAFRTRVSLAAEAAIPDTLTESLLGAVAPAVALRPGGDEAATAWRNVTGLAFDPLPVAYAQGAPPQDDLVGTLGSIVDVGEAAALFRFPDW
jgi:hypothetical protein